MKSEARVGRNTVNKSSRVLLNKRRGLKLRSSHLGALGWSKSGEKSFSGDRRTCRNLREGDSSRPRPSVECRALLQNRLNFSKSGIPERLMFYWRGGWNDFPVEAAEKLRRAFIAKNSCVEVEIDGSSYLIDFLRMLQTDLRACCQRSIAWIDCNGKCFFPMSFVGENGTDGDCYSSPLKLEIEIHIDRTEGSKIENGNRVREVAADRISEVSRTREKEVPLLAQTKTKDADDNLGVDKVIYEGSVNLANRGNIKETNTNSGCAGIVAELKQNEVSSKCVNGVNTVSLNCPTHAKTNNFTDGFCDSVTRKPTSMKRTLDAAPEENNHDIPDHGSISWKKICLADMPCGSVAVYKTPKIEIISDDLDGKKLTCQGENGFLHASSELNEGNDAGVSDIKEKTQSGAQEFRGSSTSASDRSKHSSGLTASFTPKQPKSEPHELPAVCNENQVQALKPISSCFTREIPRFASLGTKLTRLMESEKAYRSVRNMFIRGIGKFDRRTTISAIHCCSRESPLSHTRFQAFLRHLDMTKHSRGDPNVKYAWHGASAKDLESIVLHGFGRPKTCNGSDAYGVGIYLSHEALSELSAFCVDPDENGEQHVILCQVITGNVEKVQAGSSQFHPTNENFDIGVDNLSSPRYYVVWSTHMNTHILPEYIVTFKVSDNVREAWRTKVSQDSRGVSEHCSSPTEIAKSTPRSPPPAIVAEKSPNNSTNVYGQIKENVPTLGMTSNMSLPTLFGELEKSLKCSNIELLKNLYSEYKEGKIGKDTLIKKIRSIAGDELLINTINRIRRQA